MAPEPTGLSLEHSLTRGRVWAQLTHEEMETAGQRTGSQQRVVSSPCRGDLRLSLQGTLE